MISEFCKLKFLRMSLFIVKPAGTELPVIKYFRNGSDYIKSHTFISELLKNER